MSLNVVWTIVLGAGAIQGLFVGSAVLFGRKGNRRFAQLIATLLAIFAVAIFARVLQDEVAPNAALLIAFLNINTELTIGPVYFLIIRSLVLPERPLRSVDLLHFLPFLIGLVTWGFAWLGVEDHLRLMRSGFDTEYPVFAFLVFKATILFAYVAASCRLLRRASQDSRQLYAGRHRVDAAVLLRLTVCLGSIPALIYVVSGIDHLGYAPDLNSDLVGSLLLVGVIFAVAWLLMFRPWVLSLKAEGVESRRYRKEARRLESYLTREKPWLEPELRSADIARRMAWSESYLSSVVKHGMQTTFNGLVNDYRLAEFERLARDAESGDVLTLAFEAGFGSKAAFYRVFKAAHGTTPTQYRDSLSESPREASRFSS